MKLGEVNQPENPAESRRDSVRSLVRILKAAIAAAALTTVIGMGRLMTTLEASHSTLGENFRLRTPEDDDPMLMIDTEVLEQPVPEEETTQKNWEFTTAPTAVSLNSESKLELEQRVSKEGTTPKVKEYKLIRELSKLRLKIQELTTKNHGLKDNVNRANTKIAELKKRLRG